MPTNRKVSLESYQCLRNKYDIALQKNAEYEVALYKASRHNVLFEHEFLNKLQNLKLLQRIKYVFRKDSINEYF